MPTKRPNQAAIMEQARKAGLSNPEALKETRKRRVAARREISRTVSYPLEEFLKYSGLTKAAYRQARRSGLQVKKVGDSVWVTGEAWFEYLSKQEQPQ